MYTTDSESHTLSVTRLLGDEKEQLKKNFTVYISSGSRTDETSFLKIQTHNTIFMLSSTCLAIHADRNENIPISIAQSKLTPTTIRPLQINSVSRPGLKHICMRAGGPFPLFIIRLAAF